MRRLNVREAAPHAAINQAGLVFTLTAASTTLKEAFPVFWESEHSLRLRGGAPRQPLLADLPALLGDLPPALQGGKKIAKEDQGGPNMC